MRKAKPKKKLEPKPNEKKPIPVTKWDPMIERKKEAAVFVSTLKQMENHLEKHREIWKASYKEGGFLKQKYKIQLGRAINLAAEIIEEYKEEGIEYTPYAAFAIDRKIESIVQEQRAKKGFKQIQNIRSVDRAKDHAYDDATVPGGAEFFNTVLGAWGCSVIIGEKFLNFAKAEGNYDKVQKMMEAVSKYFQMVDTTIVRLVADLPTASERKRIFRKLPAKDIERIHKELRAKGYSI